MKEFGQVIKELRNSKGISQEALGNIVHVSRSAIAKYENGLGLPSEEVIEELCKYFEVKRDYLFPKENIEQLITDKNIVISKQKKKTMIIAVSLSLIIIILLVIISSSNSSKNNSVVLEDTIVSINIDNTYEYQNDIILFEYDGGYVYQRIEIKEIEFTNVSNLYLLRVQNTYVNGYMANMNGASGFKEDQFTEKAYMSINFPTSYNNVYPIASWHQKHSTKFSFSSQIASNENINFNEKINLFDGAFIEKKSQDVLFSYDCSITNWLFDYEYNNILRKCTINNNYYNSSWEYEMIDEISKKVSFTITSSYLFESKPNQIINFEIDTKMFNTDMSIQQKKIFELLI